MIASLPQLFLWDPARVSGYTPGVENMLTLLLGREIGEELVTGMGQGAGKHSPSDALESSCTDSLCFRPDPQISASFCFCLPFA